jgi:SAM-dependent methyltransferase
VGVAEVCGRSIPLLEEDLCLVTRHWVQRPGIDQHGFALTRTNAPNLFRLKRWHQFSNRRVTHQDWPSWHCTGAVTLGTLNGMPAYETFGKFYDTVMGDRSRPAEHLWKIIRAAKPNARNLLELGCGTGSMLKHLQHNYQVSGLDTSRRMLSIARHKVPHSKLFRQDMVDFQIDGRFDVICCVFDSINHVRRFSGWKKVFTRVRRHLSPGGCFIFDINTQRKLERHISEPPWVHRFGKNVLIINVTALPKRASNWNIKVFEHVTANRYLLHEEDIVEVSFPSQQIVTALRAHFAKVRVIDPDCDRPTAKSERLFFIATTATP